jgi:hypothetical protein
MTAWHRISKVFDCHSVILNNPSLGLRFMILAHRDFIEYLEALFQRPNIDEAIFTHSYD